MRNLTRRVIKLYSQSRLQLHRIIQEMKNEKSVSPVVSTTEVLQLQALSRLSTSKTKEENSIQTRDSEGSNSSILLVLFLVQFFLNWCCRS